MAYLNKIEKHVFLVGQTGSGKTQNIINAAINLLNSSKKEDKVIVIAFLNKISLEEFKDILKQNVSKENFTKFVNVYYSGNSSFLTKE